MPVWIRTVSTLAIAGHSGGKYTFFSRGPAPMSAAHRADHDAR